MAYTSSALNLVSVAPLAKSGQVWHHESVDAGSVVQVDGFITDAADKGMRVGDIVLHRETDTNIVSSFVVAAVNANGSADLTNATTVASGTDAD